MRRALVLAVLAVTTLACGQRPRPMLIEEDAGVSMELPDAGRQQGMDPPSGFSIVAEQPVGQGRFGVSVASAPDQFNQPLIAAVWDDPNNDGQRADSRVVFTRWNGETRAFEMVKTIEVVGEIDLSHPNRQVSVARDALTGRIGVAYVKPGTGIRYAFSDDEGANFSLSTVGQDPGAGDPSNPVLALRGGTAHVAYVTSTEQVLYRTRSGSTGTFSEAQAPVTAGQASAFGPIAMALDSAGAPGLAYFTKGASLRGTLAFWRPGSATASPITDSNMTDVLMPATRRPSVSLVFVGTTPRVAFHLLRADPVVGMGGAEPMTDSNPELWTSVASDASGASWSTPVGMPRNGNMVAMRFNSTRWYQGLAVHPNGSITIAGAYLANGTTNTLCGGGPKIARSTDGMSFTTCVPMNTTYGQSGEWLSLYSHAANKVTLTFFYEQPVMMRNQIVLYREP
jgi:hypothetical protein